LGLDDGPGSPWIRRNALQAASSLIALGFLVACGKRTIGHPEHLCKFWQKHFFFCGRPGEFFSDLERTKGANPRLIQRFFVSILGSLENDFFFVGAPCFDSGAGCCDATVRRRH
jgi:hypothetical protein